MERERIGKGVGQEGRWRWKGCRVMGVEGALGWTGLGKAGLGWAGLSCGGGISHEDSIRCCYIINQQQDITPPPSAFHGGNKKQTKLI